jgi:hypothetical protein
MLRASESPPFEGPVGPAKMAEVYRYFYLRGRGLSEVIGRDGDDQSAARVESISTYERTIAQVF